MRAEARAIGVGVTDESALEEGGDDVAQRVMNDAVAVGRERLPRCAWRAAAAILAKSVICGQSWPCRFMAVQLDGVESSPSAPGARPLCPLRRSLM